MASNSISVLPIVGSEVFELCLFEIGKPKYVGYYDDPAAADKYIAEHQSYNIFITPQKLNPTLIQRSHNRMILSNERTKDAEVLSYRYLLIDLDANQKIDDLIVHRPSGVSAADEEHNAALAVAKQIITDLQLKDENYLLIDSGNGAHIYIPVEEGTQEPAIKAAINGLKTLYDTELIQIDPAVFNLARLMRAPGSINCKGAIKRPVVYLHSPEHLMPVDFKFIAGLKVETVPEPAQKDKNVNLAKQIADQLGYAKEKHGMYLLKECPFCHSTDNGAVVGRVEPDGGYFFKCHHKRCDGNKWSELKTHVGLSTGTYDQVRKTLKEQGSAALEMPEVQAEISKLKANGELYKLEGVCKEVGIEYKALKRAARKPFAIAQDMSDGWISEYHIKTDKITRDIYYYQDGVYVDATDFIAGLIDSKFRGINTTGFIANVLDYIRRHSLYEFKDEYLGVNNGIINPITLEVTGFKPEIVTRIRLNVTYDPAATCPNFENFIDECKSDKILLQETGGYPLLPGYPYQKAIMLLGAGGQGKSVFLRIICDILGVGNVSAAALQTLVENRFATADLYCRLANVAGDLSDMALSKTATFKQLTGDDRIRAEKKGQDAFDFWNRAKLIFSANQLPPTKDKTGGYFRRWILIDFLREMVQNPNPHLAAELLAERSGIFNWMLTGARRVNAQGFTYTTDPEKMERRYIERSEPIIKFLEFACSEDFDGFIESQTLYTAYNNWAKATRGKKMSGREFINAMKNQNTYSVEYGRKTTYSFGEPRPVGFFGLNFKPAISDKNVEGRPERGLDKFGVKAAA